MTHQMRKDIGSRLRVRRCFLGLTREEFSLLAGISPGYYGQIEAGRAQMSVDTLIKVADTARLSTDALLFASLPPPADHTALDAILSTCSPRDLRLAEQMLQLFLLRSRL